MPTVTIDIDSRRLQRRLKLLADTCSGNTMNGALRAIGEMLVLTTQERIQQGVSPNGAPFAPLSPVTLEIRREKGRMGSKPLIDTEELLRSGISYRPIDGGIAIIASRKGSHAVQLGATGAGRGRKVTIPARPFLGVSDGDLREIDNIILNILSRVRSGGLS
jgi:phage virion morphogenesis protein